MGASSLYSAYDNGEASIYSTSSLSPTGGRLLIACGHGRGSATVAKPSCAGFGAWTEIGDTPYDDAGATRGRITAYGIILGGSPGSDAIDFDFGAAQIGCHLEVVEFDDADVSGAVLDAIVQALAMTPATTAAPAIALSTFADEANYALGFFGGQANAQMTQGGGFTLLGRSNGAAPASCFLSEFVAGDESVDATGTSSTYGGLAFEIAKAVAGGDVELAATIASSSAVAAALTVEKPLSATLASSSPVAAALRVEKPLAAAIASASRLVGTLEGSAIVRRLRALLGVGQ